MTKDEALKLALEALERMERFGNTFGYRSWEQNPYKQVCEAITAINQALALDKKAENARELGLDYEPAPVQDMPKIGCVNHDCDRCKTAVRRGWVGLTRWEIDAKLKENK